MPYKNIRLKINNKTTYKREIFVISSCIKYKALSQQMVDF